MAQERRKMQCPQCGGSFKFRLQLRIINVEVTIEESPSPIEEDETPRPGSLNVIGSSDEELDALDTQIAREKLERFLFMERRGEKSLPSLRKPARKRI